MKYGLRQILWFCLSSQENTLAHCSSECFFPLNTFGLYSKKIHSKFNVKKIPFAVVPPFPNTSYQILCPKLIQGVSDPKKVAGIILEQTGLADDTFRLGNTKARLFTLFWFFLYYRIACASCCYIMMFFFWFK